MRLTNKPQKKQTWYTPKHQNFHNTIQYDNTITKTGLFIYPNLADKCYKLETKILQL